MIGTRNWAKSGGPLSFGRGRCGGLCMGKLSARCGKGELRVEVEAWAAISLLGAVLTVTGLANLDG